MSTSPLSLPSMPSLGQMTGLAPSAVTQAVQTAVNPATTGTSTPGLASNSLTQYVMIIVGLLFIAAGIFTFDKTKNFIVNSGKAAATAAATA